MLLIDDDELEITDRRKDGRARPHHHPRLAGGERIPAIEPLALAEMAVPDDRRVAGRNGLELLKALRQHNHMIRVVMLTALSEESHILQCFEAGADDYMSKPFSPRELVARIQAQFRRVTEGPDAIVQQLDLPGGVTVDLARLEVRRGDEVIMLTPREGDILEYLIKHNEKVVTREDLLRDVWQYRNPNVATRTVDIHIVGLRRKIEPDAASPTLIQTVRGKGYRWYN